MEEKKTPTKSVIYYYIGVFVTMILLNALLLPLLRENQITKVDYGTFIMKVDSGLVKTVSIHDDLILFTLQKDDNTGEANSFGPKDQLPLLLQEGNDKEPVCSTVPLNNPGAC
ncbi:MAG: hypothetical protein U5L72_14775 [Bacteroidales bacterium]|nr:hypothetical protein [Bacteroidales bacterium]